MPIASEASLTIDQKPLREGPLRLLWVDDDPHLAAGFARRLHRYKIRLIHAYDGMQGYWIAATQRPDAIVTDLKMPKWPGDELVACLSANHELNGIPLIVVSGYMDDHDKKHLVRMGVSAVLDKPVQMEQLLEVLGTLIPDFAA
jgi:DNA-binding response OmpR family regulator